MSSASVIGMLEELETYENALEGGGDTTREFWYLAGPMSNIKAFNFPEFHRVAAILRGQDFNIVNPAELDHETARAEAEASPDGTHTGLAHTKTWAECLLRDLPLVGNPNCKGVIVIDGWERSQGAQWETYTAMKLDKPIMRYTDNPYAPENFSLRAIIRRVALEAAGVVDA